VDFFLFCILEALNSNLDAHQAGCKYFMLLHVYVRKMLKLYLKLCHNHFGINHSESLDHSTLNKYNREHNHCALGAYGGYESKAVLIPDLLIRVR
jgi:hypothetical protein